MSFFAKFLLKKIYKKLSYKASFCALIFLSACSSSIEVQDQNKKFETKYGEETKKINQERKKELSETNLVLSPTSFVKDQQELIKEYQEQNYPYADIAKLGDNPHENFLPNGEVYQQLKSRNPQESLPANMFIVSYNTEKHPQYRYDKSEFDGVSIPTSDNYGVKTELMQKPYLMAGNNHLQKSVDRLNRRLTNENIEFSKILIAEKKKYRSQQKMINIFGEEEITNSQKLNDTEKKKVDKKDDAKNKSSEKPQIASNITIPDPTTLKPLPKSAAAQ